MIKLSDSKNVSKASEFTMQGQDFIEVPAFGDGNCALNALALGLIDLIKQGKLQLAADKQARFMRELTNNLAILKKRQASYAKKNSDFHDMAGSLAVVISAIEKNQKDYAQFAQFIQSHSSNRLEVAALHVALAPALRKIGVDLYRGALGAQSKKAGNVKGLLQAEMKDASKLYVDGTSAGVEILIPLARDFLGVNLRLYDFAEKAPIVYFNPITTEREDVEVKRAAVGAVVPEICLLKKPGHWDFAYHAEQTTGLAAGDALVAPSAEAQSVNVVSKTENETGAALAQAIELVVLEQSKDLVLKNKPARIPAELKEVTALMDQVNESLIGLSGLKTNQRATLASEHDEFSSSIVATVRDHLALTEEKLDAVVDTSKASLAALKKDLLLGKSAEAVATNRKSKAVTAQITTDEHLARALQNAEILSFLNERYAALSGRAPVKHVREVLPVEAEHNKKPKLK